jgi:hypothetical protein
MKIYMTLLILIFPICFFSVHAHSASEQEFKKVASEVEKINSLRETLVGAVPDKPDLNTFKAVCAPVGKKAKMTAKKNGWKFRQASHKNRNPEHAANKLELEAISFFLKHDQKVSYWLKKGKEHHYFRKITVQKACLKCHGLKENRPEFVTKKFPKDKAYGFKEGDLRGIYHVIIE